MTGSVLSSGEAAAILFGLFFLLMFLRVPIAFALALASLPILLIEPRLSTVTMVQETFNAYNSFILLAVPFFLLTANLMNIGGITDRLLRLARTMVGHFPGGLAQINVVLSIFFAGVSGSSTADAASQSKIFIEAQTREGYDLSFSVAITAVSAVLAVIIPPSILMIVWGGILNVSIGALFLAGILPGLLIGLAQMATVHAYAVARGYQTYPKATWGALGISLFVSIPALVTPGIIIGGKLFGWFTATESGCIAVLYGGFLALLVYREMDLAGLKQALLDTGKLAGITLFCVGTASVFGWLLAYYQIPRAILSGVAEWGMGPIQTGFFIAVVFLVVGCFLDAIPAIIIVGTILSPMAASAGLDPVHFAMIGIIALAFGLVTPPYGLCLLIACSIAGIRMTAALKDTMIMLIPMLAVLALVIVWPAVVLLIPSFAAPGVHAVAPAARACSAYGKMLADLESLRVPITRSSTRTWATAGPGPHDSLRAHLHPRHRRLPTRDRDRHPRRAHLPHRAFDPASLRRDREVRENRPLGRARCRRLGSKGRCYSEHHLWNLDDTADNRFARALRSIGARGAADPAPDAQ